MADEIIRLDYSAEDIVDNIDEVREARGEYDSLDERLDEIEGGGFTPTTEQLAAMNSGITAERLATDENNISYNTNNGVKNYLPINSGATTGAQYVFDWIAKDIPAGRYIISFSTETASGAAAIEFGDSNAASYNQTGYRVITLPAQSAEVTVGANTHYVRIFANVALTMSNIMLRPASISDTTYQPYALSNTAITPALIECVDNGAKNSLPATSTTTSTNNGLTLVVNSDYSITITGTMTTVKNTDIYFFGSWTNTSPFANYTGKNMRMYCKSSASIVGQFKMYDRTANKGYAVAINNNEGVGISGDLTAAYFTIAATDDAINVTLYPMICEPSLYIVSQQYVPPAMSNAELTAAIQALQAQLNQ